VNKVHKIICGMCNQTAGIFRSWLSCANQKELQSFIAIIFLVKYYASDEPQRNTGKKHNGTEHPLWSLFKNFVGSVVKKNRAIILSKKMVQLLFATTEDGLKV